MKGAVFWQIFGSRKFAMKGELGDIQLNFDIRLLTRRAAEAAVRRRHLPWRQSVEGVRSQLIPAAAASSGLKLAARGLLFAKNIGTVFWPIFSPICGFLLLLRSLINLIYQY